MHIFVGLLEFIVRLCNRLCNILQLYTWDILTEEIFSDRAWRRNDSFDDIAREAFEPVLHVSNNYTDFFKITEILIIKSF